MVRVPIDTHWLLFWVLLLVHTWLQLNASMYPCISPSLARPYNPLFRLLIVQLHCLRCGFPPPPIHTHRRAGSSPHRGRLPQERLPSEGARRRPGRPYQTCRGPGLPPPVRRPAPGGRRPDLRLGAESSRRRRRERGRDGRRRGRRSAGSGSTVVGHVCRGVGGYTLGSCSGGRRRD